MARHTFSTHLRRRLPGDGVNEDASLGGMSSLIDLCFLLLIYFLVTTTIQPREQDLSVHIPVPTEEPVESISPMVVEVREDGTVVVNPGDGAETYEQESGGRELPGLRRRLDLLAILPRGKEPRVLMRVHDGVRQQRYIDVLNCLAGAGIRDIALENAGE